MKAHLMEDCVLVTGTLDPHEARDFLASEVDKASRNRSPMAGSLYDAYELAHEATAYPERGNTIPCQPGSDYRWSWHAKETGRVKAVRFE